MATCTNIHINKTKIVISGLKPRKGNRKQKRKTHTGEMSIRKIIWCWSSWQIHISISDMPQQKNLACVFMSCHFYIHLKCAFSVVASCNPNLFWILSYFLSWYNQSWMIAQPVACSCPFSLGDWQTNILKRKMCILNLRMHSRADSTLIREKGYYLIL